jgi:hypothetical protein
MASGSSFARADRARTTLCLFPGARRENKCSLGSRYARNARNENTLCESSWKFNFLPAAFYEPIGKWNYEASAMAHLQLRSRRLFSINDGKPTAAWMMQRGCVLCDVWILYHSQQAKGCHKSIRGWISTYFPWATINLIICKKS